MSYGMGIDRLTITYVVFGVWHMYRFGKNCVKESSQILQRVVYSLDINLAITTVESGYWTRNT